MSVTKRSTYDRNYYLKNKEKHKAAGKRWLANRLKREPDYLKKAYIRKRTPENIARQKEGQRTYHRKLRLELLNHYSNGKNCCACCGEAHLEFLCIDHINGGGNQHIKQIKRDFSLGLYKWLRVNKYPEGFRVLCHNCNMSRGAYKYCPHENENTQS